MKFRIKITRHAFGYAVFAMAALFVFLYVRFPGDMFARHLAAIATDLNPDAMVLIDSVKPAIPPGINFKNVKLGFRDNPAATIYVDTFTLKPAWLSLFKGQTTFVLTAKTYGGSVEAQAATKQFLAADGPIDGKLNLDGIDIASIGYLRERLGRQISGNLKGTMTFSGTILSPASGVSTFEFTLVDGSYRFQESIMGMDRLEFKKVEASIGMKNGVLTVNRLKLAGDKINGTLSGNIVLNGTDIKSSLLSLNFAFELPGQNKKLSLVMTGTLANPLIKYT